MQQGELKDVLIAQEQEEKKGTIPHILAVVRAKRALRAYQVSA